MCTIAGGVIAAASVVQSAASLRANNKAIAAQTDMQRRQSIQAVKQLNYQEADSHLEAMDNMDQARQELTAKSMENIRAMGTLRAAMGESNLEGNSMRRIARVTEGDYIREQVGLSENYTRDYAKIFTGQLVNRESVASQIKETQKSEGKQSHGLLAMLGGAGGIGQLAGQAAASYQTSSKDTGKGGKK